VTEDPRDALLEVARDIVAKRGYLGLTMRTASAAAGITPEVARRYYRNRDSLFAAAMRLPADPVSAIPALIAPGIEGMGERLVRFTLDTLKDPEARRDLMSLARTGVHAGQAVTGLQEFIEVGVVDRVAGAIGVPDARMRSALITSYLMGVAIMRYGVRLEPLASASDEEVVRMVAPVIQDLLDPRRPIPGSARARAQGSAAAGESRAAQPRSRSFDPDPAATRARRAAALAEEAERLRGGDESRTDSAQGSRSGSTSSGGTAGAPAAKAPHAGADGAPAAVKPPTTRSGTTKSSTAKSSTAKSSTAKSSTTKRTPAEPTTGKQRATAEPSAATATRSATATSAAGKDAEAAAPTARTSKAAAPKHARDRPQDDDGTSARD
jgi:AcrR family transcriptional regulator